MRISLITLVFLTHLSTLLCQKIDTIKLDVVKQIIKPDKVNFENDSISISLTNCEKIHKEEIEIIIKRDNNGESISSINNCKPLKLKNEFNDSLILLLTPLDNQLKIVINRKTGEINLTSNGSELILDDQEEKGQIVPKKKSFKVLIPSHQSIINKDFFIPNLRSSPNLEPNCVITYTPCNNEYKIHQRDKSIKGSLWLKYDPKGDCGCKSLTFLVQDFNPKVYKFNLSKYYNIYNTQEPELWTKNLGLINTAQTTTTAQTSDTQIFPRSIEIEETLRRMARLYIDLETFIDAKNIDDCLSTIDFSEQKQNILDTIGHIFAYNGNKSLNITRKYRELKSKYIYTNKITLNTFLDSFTYNIEGIGILNPDSLVTATQGLVNSLAAMKFEYQYNIPQLQNADEIVFKMEITSQEGQNGTIHMKNEEIIIPIKGGWKIDFSTGFYYSNFSNGAYSIADTTFIIENDTIDKKQIFTDNSGNGTIGAIALMHVYPKLGNLKPALSVGIGASTNLNYSFLLGGSLILGRKNRIVLSGGYNYSNVKRLAKNYLQVDEKRLLPQEKTEVSTYNKGKGGFFLSLTYSLGLTKKSQEIQLPTQNNNQPTNNTNSNGGSDGSNSGNEASKKNENKT